MQKMNFNLLTICILGGGHKLASSIENKRFKTTKISLV